MEITSLDLERPDKIGVCITHRVGADVVFLALSKLIQHYGLGEIWLSPTWYLESRPFLNDPVHNLWLNLDNLIPQLLPEGLMRLGDLYLEQIDQDIHGVNLSVFPKRIYGEDWKQLDKDCSTLVRWATDRKLPHQFILPWFLFQQLNDQAIVTAAQVIEQAGGAGLIFGGFDVQSWNLPEGDLPIITHILKKNLAMPIGVLSGVGTKPMIQGFIKQDMSKIILSPLVLHQLLQNRV